jgi:F0F1-type ATP synthase assembly protein I
MELPVILVGCIAVGGGLGYLMDRWLHMKALFTLLLGGLGFVAGITEVIRRLSKEEKREQSGR